MGAAAAGVSTISVARVATGFMSLHSARVINLGHYAASREPGLAPQSTRSRLRLRRRASNLEGTFQGLHKQMPPAQPLFLDRGRSSLLLPACEGSPVGGKELGVPLALVNALFRAVVPAFVPQDATLGLDGTEKLLERFLPYQLHGERPHARRRADCSTGTRSACCMVAEVERWLRPVDDFDYLIRRWLTPVHFEEPTQSTPPKKVFVQRTAPLSSYVQHAIGQHLRLQYALESSLPLRLAKLATEVEQRNSMAEGSYAST